MKDGARWEPWQPRVGERVRVRLNAECPHCPENNPARHLIVYLEPRDGRVGTIYAIREGGPTYLPGHRYVVTWDEPLPVEIALSGATLSHGGTFAALELRPAARGAP